MDPSETPPNAIIGGRVCTRTGGRSLHVNLLPGTGRICALDCLYCPFPRADGWQRCPRPGDVGTAVMNALHGAAALESITISLPGEPTLHPEFGRAFGEVLSARRVRPELPVRIVTNGTTLLSPRVRRLLGFADECVVRIDAGGERISRPARSAPHGALAAALCELPDFSVESVFVQGPEGNTNERDVDEWIAQLGELHPCRVYVTTIAETPLAPTVRRADVATLERIAAELRRRAGLDARVIP